MTQIRPRKQRRTHTGAGVALKSLKQVVPHPYYSLPLMKLGVEKQLFNLWHRNRRTGLAGRIRQASFRITDICNLRCHSCGQWGPTGFLHGQDLKTLKKDEVSPGRYLDVFGDMVDQGHRPIVYFWGGEPMLYDGILEVIEGGAQLGMPVCIATNGTHLAEAAERMVGAPMFLIQVSIDGPSAEVHNVVRPSAGRGDNFRDIEAGLEAVRRARKKAGRRLPMIASLTVISQANLPHLVEIYETFRDRVDLFVFYLSWWIDEQGARDHERDFNHRFGFYPEKHRGWIGDWMLSDHERLSAQLKRLRAASRPWNAPPIMIMPNITDVDDLNAYYTDHGECFGFNQCISIHQAVEVNSNGNMSPCRDYHDFVVGNIKQNTITELWNCRAYRTFRQSLHNDGLMPVCSRCCGLMGY